MGYKITNWKIWKQEQKSSKKNFVNWVWGKEDVQFKFDLYFHW